jgi:hypothetical protein
MGIRYQTRKILIPVIFSLLVFVCMDLILAGILIRSADRSFRTSHPYYHHGLIPGQRALASWNNINYPVFTNSMGFRDSLIRDIPLKTGRRRILFMGDSHTEGVGLRFEDTFTGQITSRLDPEEYEILNGAAVSYSPRIYYLKTKYLIEERGLEFDELFVFIDISDIQNEIVYRDFNPRHPGLFGRWRFSAGQVLVNRSYTVNTLGKLRQAAVTRKFIEKTELFDEYRSADVQVDALDLYASFFSGFDDKTLLSNPMFHGVAEWMYDPVRASGLFINFAKIYFQESMDDNNILERLEGVRLRFEEVEQLLTDPAVAGDMQRYIKLNKEYRELEPVVKACMEYKNILSNIDSAKEILSPKRMRRCGIWPGWNSMS